MPEHSGLYWEVDHRGRMLAGRKVTYGQAFGVYALAEYFRATGVREALERAMRLFDDIETHAFDPVNGGYWEARGRDWQPIDDIRLSDLDLNAPFSMNNHLHLLEAYTTLALVSGGSPTAGTPAGRARAGARPHLRRQERPPDPVLRRALAVDVGRDLIRPRHRGQLVDLRGRRGAGRSPLEAARADSAAVRMADAVLAGGYDAELGGVYKELTPDGHLDTTKDWWPQAEAVVGFLNAYRLSGRAEHLPRLSRRGTSSTPS
jgi:mannobiose 2-epimerase